MEPYIINLAALIAPLTKSTELHQRWKNAHKCCNILLGSARWCSCQMVKTSRVWIWFTTYTVCRVTKTTNKILRSFFCWKSQRGGRDLESTSNTYKSSILPPVFSHFLFLRPFYPLLSTSLELKYTAQRSTRNGFDSLWSEHQYIISRSAFSAQSAIFILCWFLPISHLFYEDLTCLFFTPVPFSSVSSSISFSPIPSSSHPYLHPVSIHFMEENTKRVRLGGYISVQQAGCGDGQLHPGDAVLRCDTARLAFSGRAQSVGHGLRSQLITLEERKRRQISRINLSFRHTSCFLADPWNLKAV